MPSVRLIGLVVNVSSDEPIIRSTSLTAMNTADEAMRMRLHRALSTYFPTPEEKIAEVTAIYDALHIREDAEKEIERYFNFALDALDKVEVDAQRKEEIRKLALRLMKRQK